MDNSMMMAAWRKARRSILKYQGVAFMGLAHADSRPENYPEQLQSINDAIPFLVSDAPVFCCTNETLDAFTGEDQHSIINSVGDMMRARVFKLPHDPCVFITDFEDHTSLAFICHKPAEDEGVVVVHSIVMYKEEKKHGRCMAMPGIISIDTEAGEDEVLKSGPVGVDMLIKHESTFVGKYGDIGAEQYWKESIDAAGFLFCVFMVMMATRGIQTRDCSLLEEPITESQRSKAAEYAYSEVTMPTSTLDTTEPKALL